MKKLVAVLCLTLFLLIGCSSSDTPKEETKSEYSIGETAETKNFNITVNSIKSLDGNEFISPDEGEEWIAIDMTFENTGEESKYIGGIFELSLKDQDGRSKDYNIFGDTDGSLDGDVLPGEKLSGEISFIISGDEASLILYYQPTFSTSKPIKFTIK